MIYKTIMDETDSSDNKISFNGMSKMIGGDSSQSNKFMKAAMQLNKQMSSNGYITTLTAKPGNTIAIEMRVDTAKQVKSVAANTAKADTDLLRFKRLMSMATQGVMLRGEVTNEGEIKSFYLKNEQRSLIALFFQLPGRPVKVGDSWPIDVHLVSADQSFICDSAYRKNEVEVVNISNKSDDEIVTLKYDFVEYITGNISTPMFNISQKTSMGFSFQGTADFSVSKGKWIDYNGVMSEKSTGMMSVQDIKRFALIPQ